MTWILTVLSVIGVVLNIRQNRVCFVVWSFTNAAWCVIDSMHGIYAQSALFALYFMLSLWGMYEWRRKAVGV